MNKSELKMLFLDALNEHDIPNGGIKWHDIEEHYAGRDFHNLKHVCNVATRAYTLAGRNNIVLPDWTWVAITYHDVIYDLLSMENESNSAIYATQDMGRFTMRDTDPRAKWISSVSMGIRYTKHSCFIFPEYIPVATQIIIDADLYELSTNKYDANAQLVRDEFGDLITNDQWCEGRKKFLEKFVVKNQDRWVSGPNFRRIFHLDGPDGTAAELDARVRANMQRELERLSNQ